MINCEYNFKSKDLSMCCLSKFSALTSYVMAKIKNFSLLDFSIMKICMVTWGIMMGVKFSKCFRKVLPIFVLTAFATYLYLVYKIFFCDED